MVFSSPFFIFVFLPAVLFLIGITRKYFHNIILLIASLFFYAWGSVSHSFIFIFSILLNYVFGLLIAKEKSAKLFLGIAIIANLLLLGYFKYFNFFIENINSFLSGSNTQPIIIQNIVLPIGISFFTFHALSYIIDVYRGRVSAQRNLLDLALYISFFPQLIAGPIVRYIDVADQLNNRTLSLNKATTGIQRFIFGFAKKVIIANTMGAVVDQVFDIPTNQISSGLAWLGIIAYTFQIYFDFSGYSDMALGLAKVFGFNFPENFNYPYVAQSVKEFWRRWHISLSTWFRDFLYIPLGGNKKGKKRTIINLLIVFFCTGLWHGASWNFIIWGLFHGMFLLIERIGGDKIISHAWKPLRIGYTLLIVMVGWVFFRSENLEGAFGYLSRMSFIPSTTNLQMLSITEFINAKIIFILIVATLYSFGIFRWGIKLIEQSFRTINKEHSYQLVFHSGKFVTSMSLFLITLLYLAGSTYNPFIYFRF
ncbi:MAG: MBOAT family O-acyltransferase [Bacteroidota bacterium]